MNTTPVIDTKIRDTSADQVLRFFLRFLNLLWVLTLFATVWPLGIVWLIGSVVVMVQLRKRRMERYSRNAVTLAKLNTWPGQPNTF